MRTTLLAFLALVAVAPFLAAQPQGRNLTVDGYFRIQRISDPQVSPDGEWIAYTIGTTNLEEEKAETRIWMVPVAGGDPISMTALGSSASRPRWSPDGKYLAFLSARNDEKKQVWTLFRHGGDAVQRTKVRQGVDSFEWSPDGSRMVLIIKDPKQEEPEEKDAKDEKKTPKPWVIGSPSVQARLHRLPGSSPYAPLHFEYRHRRANTGHLCDFDDSQPACSPNGKRIAFVSNRTEEPDNNYNTDIWVVDSENLDQQQELLRITTNLGPDRSPAWSPNGQSIAHVAETDVEVMVYATPHLAVAASNGGKTDVLTQRLDRHIASPRFSMDGRPIYFVLEDSGEANLASIPAGGGPVTRVVQGPRVVNAYSLGRGGAVVALVSEPHFPPEVFTLKEGELEQITHANEELLAEVRLGETENAHFKSKDGTDIEGFVTKPPDFQRGVRYPTLLRIHGGPISQYDFGFSFETQLFAANGYVVVRTNPRGSSGYGQDFSLGIWQSWGEKDSEDVLAGVDYAIEQGYADPDRLGVGGWSYGGILTNHVITRTDRFKAAITGASETLYIVNYGHDHYQRWWEREVGLPWENRELWEKMSPFNQVENIVTPTLIMGGEKDWNVPINNSELLYQALRRLGRTTELVVYPNQHHGLRVPSYQKDRFERYLSWYGKYVKGVDEATN